MQTDLRALQAALNAYDPQILGNCRPFSFSGYRIVKDPARLGEMAQELLILPAALAELVASQPAAAYICVRESDEPVTPLSGSQTAPALILTSKKPLEELAEEIQRALFLPYRYDQLKGELLDALAGGDGLDQILCRATFWLGNPFTVFDNNFSLLAHSIPEDMDIPEARQVVEHKSANLYVLVELRDSGELGQLQNQTAHVRSTNLPNGYQKLSCVLSANHRHIGLLCFYNYARPFQPGDSEIVEYVGKIVCAYLQRQNLPHASNWNPYEYFIHQLLENHYDDISVEQFRKKLELNFPSEMAAMLVSASQYERQRKNVPLSLITQELRRLFPSGCICVLEDGVLCVCASKKIDMENESDTWDQVRQFLKDNRFFMGISAPFSQLSRLREYYAQADCAMTLGASYVHETAVYRYQDYILYHIISVLANHTDITQFIHPAIATLRAYDKEYKTEYLDCLRVYLECNGSIASCAQRYYMHYNSIKYRLKVIQSVCKIDFNNPNTFVQLYFSFKIQEVLDKLAYTERLNDLNMDLLDNLD